MATRQLSFWRNILAFSFLHIIAVQDALPNSVSSSYLEQGLQSTNKLTKTKMIHNGQRVLIRCNHCVKCFPSYILIKHIIFNSYCTLVSGCKPQICLHFLTGLLPIDADFQMTTQMVSTISCCSWKLLATVVALCLPNSIIITNSCEFLPYSRCELPMRTPWVSYTSSPIFGLAIINSIINGDNLITRESFVNRDGRLRDLLRLDTAPRSLCHQCNLQSNNMAQVNYISPKLNYPNWIKKLLTITKIATDNHKIIHSI